jgi:enterochelin esterase-like enzyme
MAEKKIKYNIYLSADTIALLDKLGEAIGGQSGNMLASMVVAEFSRVPSTSGAIWEALGRIHEEATAKTLNALEGGAPARAKRTAVELLPVSR